jgi:hypothetical protein
MSAETNDEKLVLHIWGAMAFLIRNVLFHVRSVRSRTQGKRTEELKEIMRLEYGENTVEPEKVLQSLENIAVWRRRGNELQAWRKIEKLTEPSTAIYRYH